MPRKIDSLSPKSDGEKPKPKPVAEHKAGEVFRPRGAEPKAGQTVAPSGNIHQPLEAKSNTHQVDTKLAKARDHFRLRTPGLWANLSKKKIAVGALIIVVVGLVIGLITSSTFRNIVTKPKPGLGNFAEIGDVKVPDSDYKRLKDAYLSFDKKNGGKTDVGQLTRRAADDSLMLAALTAESQKRGLPHCNQADVDKSLAQQYGNRGGREAYYNYLKTEYGWDASIMFQRECIEFYKHQLGDLISSGVDLYGVYIRWDDTNGFALNDKTAYEAAAKARLEKDYLPLFQSGASEYIIESKLDIGKYTPQNLYNDRLSKIGEPYSKSVNFSNFDQKQYDSLSHYKEGEDDMPYINQLKNVGDHTPIIKSNLGFYIIYRATNIHSGKFASFDDFLNDAIKNGKVSGEYYLIPAKDSSVIDQPLNPQKTQSLNDKIRQFIAPSALAASVGCFSNHGYSMEIVYADYDTRLTIIPQPMSGTSMNINSTGNVRDNCYDAIAPGSYYGYFDASYNAAGQVNFAYPNHWRNPFSLELSCYTAWQFRFNGAPTGYIPLTADDYRDPSRFLAWKKIGSVYDYRNLASPASGYFTYDQSFYQSANIEEGYGVIVYYKKNNSTNPTFSIIGNKYDYFGNKTGDFSTAPITLDGGWVSVINNPYWFLNIDSTQRHAIVASGTEGWYVSNYAGRTSGTGDTVILEPNTINNQDIIGYDFTYKPRQSVLKAGILVRDDDNNIINPCSNSAFAAQCGKDTINISRTSTDPVVPGYNSTASGVTVSPDNVITAGSMYFGQYSVSVPKYASDPNWKISGYVICNENVVTRCYQQAGGWTFVSTSNTSQLVDLGVNRTRFIYAVVERKYFATATLNCTTLSGTLTGIVDPANSRFGYKIDDVIQADIPAAANYSFTIPDKFKDGLTRNVDLFVKVNGVEKGIPTATPLKHVCKNLASCGVETVTTAFKDKKGDAGVSVKAEITMNNIGESTWKNGNTATDGWATGQHHLVFSPASAPYWNVTSIERGVLGGNIVDGQSVVPASSYKFSVTLTPNSADINTPDVPLEWGMAFVGTSDPNNNKIIEQFGPYCNSGPGAQQITVRSFYSPWLRAQNGDVTATGGQIISQAPGNRGTRKFVGSNQDINQDAAFSVIAVAGGSHFCSSNMYLFGQSNDGFAGVTPNCASSFNAYKLPPDYVTVANLFDQLSNLKTDCNSATYDPANPPADPGQRYAGIPIGFGFTTQFNMSTNCPVLYKHTGDVTVNPGTNMKTGRATLFVDGNVLIKANIIAEYPLNISNYSESGDLAQLDRSLPSFGIMASGNITIDPSVTRLDASLFAKGKINTCANYNLPATDPAGSTGLFNNIPRTRAQALACKNKLVVRGGLFADNGFSFGRNFYQYRGADLALGQIINPLFDYESIPDTEKPQGNYYGGPAEDVLGNGLNIIQAPPGFEDITQEGYAQPAYLDGDFVPRF